MPDAFFKNQNRVAHLGVRQDLIKLDVSECVCM